MMLEKLYLPIAVAILGYLYSVKKVILFFNDLTPLEGLVLYYIVIFIVLYIMRLFGLIIGNKKIDSVSQTFGELLIIYSFFIVTNMQSNYVQHVVDEENKEKNLQKECTVIYTQSEDGVVYYLYSKIFNLPPQYLRFLTFIVTPFILVLVGNMLITKKVSLS